jgi:hypothetical protein
MCQAKADKCRRQCVEVGILGSLPPIPLADRNLHPVPRILVNPVGHQIFVERQIGRPDQPGGTHLVDTHRRADILGDYPDGDNLLRLRTSHAASQSRARSSIPRDQPNCNMQIS